MDDFELDPEVLRQIEEDARRKVEEDFELDEETLKQIEQDALREAGLLDDELGEMTLAGISAETVKEMKEEKAKKATTPPPPPPPAAPAPEAAKPAATPASAPPPPAAAPATPAPAKAESKPAAKAVPVAKSEADSPADDETAKSVQDAQKKAYEKARGEAMNKAKKKMADKAKAVASKRKHTLPAASPTLTAIENEPKGGTAIIVFIAASIVVLFIIIGGVALWARNRPAPTTPGSPGSTAPVATKSDLELGQERFRVLLKEWKALEKSSDKAKIEQALADLSEFRDEYPEAAEKVATTLDNREARFKKVLALFGADGAAPPETEAPLDEPAAP